MATHINVISRIVVRTATHLIYKCKILNIKNKLKYLIYFKV